MILILFSFFSTLCTFVILICYYSFITTKNFGSKLFIYANISIFLNQLAIFLRVLAFSENSTHCFFQGFLINFSEVSIVIFSGIMSYAFYDSVIKKNAFLFLNEQAFLVLGYGYPLIIGLWYTLFFLDFCTKN